MSGIFGWLGSLDGDPHQVMASMHRHAAGPSPMPAFSTIGDRFALGAAGPPGTAFAGEFGPLRIAFHGHPLWHDGGNRHYVARGVLRAVRAGVPHDRGPRPRFSAWRFRNRIDRRG